MRTHNTSNWKKPERTDRQKWCYVSFGKWSALPQTNRGQTEDTSCYLIFLSEPNERGGKEVACCLPTTPTPIPENLKRRGRCHGEKATRHDCPFLHVFCLSSWALKRRPVTDNEEAAVTCGLSAGHGHFYGDPFLLHFYLRVDLTAKRTDVEQKHWPTRVKRGCLFLEWRKGRVNPTINIPFF